MLTINITAHFATKTVKDFHSAFIITLTLRVAMKHT